MTTAGTANNGRQNPKAFLMSLLLLLLLLLCNGAFAAASKNNNNNNVEDPYKILGVNRRANLDTIKKAYRTKAKEHHPDKNLHLDSDVANDNFRRIVDAFELLSDPIAKKRYDQTGKRQQQQQQRSSSSSSWSFNQNSGHRTTFTYRGSSNRKPNKNHNRDQQQQREKERQQRKAAEEKEERQFQQAKQNAKLLQDKVWRLSTMDELRDAMFVQTKKSKQPVYKSHLILVFVGNKKAEKNLDDGLLFPYPFAGIGANNIVWDDVVTTAKVRYNKETQLTKFYRVPKSNSKNSDFPHIIFAKKGAPVGQFNVYSQMYSNNNNKNSKSLWSKKRIEFTNWIQNQMLQMKIRVVNQHHSPVHIFRYDTHQVAHKVISSLEPGYSMLINIHLGDKLRVLDGRIDGFPGGEGFKDEMILKNFMSSTYIERMLLLDELIVHDDKATVLIKPKHCYDMSMNCHQLVLRDHTICDRQSEFMHSICSVSCGVCSEIPIWNTIQYSMFHYPIHKLPEWVHPPTEVLRSIGKVGDTFFLDIANVVSERRNVLFCFLVGGLLIGWNLAFLVESGVFDSIEYHLEKQNFRLTDILLLPLSVTVISVTYLFVSLIERSDLRDILVLYRQHLNDAIFGLLGFGIILWNMICTLYRWTFYSEGGGNIGLGVRVFLSYIILVLFAVGAVFAANYAMEINPRRKYLWTELLSIRKNAMAVIGIGGLWLGATLRSILRMAWHLKGFLLKSFAFNAIALVPVGYILWNDRFFQKDLNHVMKFRMNAAALFTITGSILGPLILNIPSYLFSDSSSSSSNNNNYNNSGNTSSPSTTASASANTTATATLAEQPTNDDQKTSVAQ